MNHIKHLFLLLLLGINFTPLAAQEPMFSTPLSQRIANYDIQVKLDAEKKVLQGKEQLKWINSSKDTIVDLQFHLYLNAFKNTESTWLKEAGEGRIPDFHLEGGEKHWGWIDIDKMIDDNGNDLAKNLEFIQPDDDNEKDQTVALIPLVEPLLPGDTINLDINFTAKLPRIIARTGYAANNYYLVAQWFPKIGVYEEAGTRYAEKGQWNCHQFHSRSEFFADFGVYNVQITAPQNFTVGASGSLYNKEENKDKTVTHSYYIEDVIDFAWTASPLFLEVKDKWKHVDLRLLITPEHFDHAERYMTATKQGLEYFDENLGFYPYKTLTIVDPPIYGAASSGMEYPTFMTGGSVYGMPKGIRSIEIVTIHEFGHQYFMQLLASNEFEEPWLDEGFNTYFENRVMTHYYGDKTSTIEMLGFEIGGVESSRLGYVGMSNPKIAPNFRPAWGFQHGGFGSLTYDKTGTWLATLDRLVGQETMTEIMKTYFERWKFKHPHANDFIDIVNEIVTARHGDKFGTSMDWYFDQVLYSANLCDYKVASIRNTRVRNAVGVFDEAGKKEYKGRDKKSKKEDEDEKKTYLSKVILHRLGEVTMPLDVLIHFENGDEVKETWGGLERTMEFSYTGDRKIEWAQIDPEYKILLDADLNNNSLTLAPDKTPIYKYAAKFMFWMENVVITLAAII